MTGRPLGERAEDRHITRRIAIENPALSVAIELTRIEAVLDLIADTLGEMVAMQRDILGADARHGDRSAPR